MEEVDIGGGSSISKILKDLPWLGVGVCHVLEILLDAFGSCMEKVRSVDDPIASGLAGLVVGFDHDDGGGALPFDLGLVDFYADGEGLGVAAKLSEKGCR